MTKQVQMINQKKFAAITLDPVKEAFIVHVAYLGAKMSIYPAHNAQIILFVAKKVTIATKYSDSVDVL